MFFDEVFPFGRAERLRGSIVEAVRDAYSENVGRFSDDLGDNNTTFAVSVVHNLRFLLEQALEGEPGIEIRRPRGSWEIQVDGSHVLHFYKASPGAQTMEDLRFDQSRTKLELVQENLEQLAFDFGQAGVDEDRPAARHLVMVHFGDSEEGLRAVHVGAPMGDPIEGYRWLWSERLDQPAQLGQLLDETQDGEPRHDTVSPPSLELSLREEEDEDPASGEGRP